MISDMLYHFPRSRFVDSNGICGQLLHIESEVAEAKAELHNPDILPVAMEIVDIYHAVETGLRILEEKYGVNVSAVMHLVADKNEKRGYYTDGR